MLWNFCKFLFLRNAGIMLAEIVLFNSLQHCGKCIFHLILTLENATFCPHVAWIVFFFPDSHNEQNFRIGINSLVYVMETQCVLVRYRPRFLFILIFIFGAKCKFSTVTNIRNHLLYYCCYLTSKFCSNAALLYTDTKYRNSNHQPVSQSV